MKSLALTFALAAFTWIGAAPNADARPHRGRGYDSHHHSSHIYVSGYHSCGTPIYTERYLIRYNRRGYPVWGYRVVAPPRHYYHAPVRRHRHVPACPPPVYYGSPRGGVVIHGSFRL